MYINKENKAVGLFAWQTLFTDIGQKLKSVLPPSDDKSTMSVTSEESLLAGEYVIERGAYKIQYSDGSVNDQGK